MSRSSDLNPNDVAQLKRERFRSIVALTAESAEDRAPARANGLHYLRIPIIDNTAPSHAQVKQFLDFLSRPENQPADVHCEAGIGRTGFMVAAERMAIEGWAPGRAIVEARRHGMTLRSQNRRAPGARARAQGGRDRRLSAHARGSGTARGLITSRRA